MKKPILIFLLVFSLTLFSLLLADITLLPLILLQLRYGEIFGIILLFIIFLWFSLRVYLQWQELQAKKSKGAFFHIWESAILTIGKIFLALTRMIFYLFLVFLFAGFVTFLLWWHQRLLS